LKYSTTVRTAASAWIQKLAGIVVRRAIRSTQYDALSGLNYMVARYQDPQRGQFLSEDPVFIADPKQQVLTDPQRLNSYSYGNDNPREERSERKGPGHAHMNKVGRPSCSHVAG
jgi:RHS repeat-associated protein